MSASTAIDRRRLLLGLREGIARRLTPDLEEQGFRLRRRDASYRREREGVGSAFSLGISSRPPALGGVGILVEPGLTVWVPAWMTEAERRIADEADRLPRPKTSSSAVCALLDWLVPGKRPHWTLPDVPADGEIDALADALHATLGEVVLPFFERLSTPALVLGAVESGEVRLLQDARFTVACGALLHGRSDLALAILAPIGTAHRQQLARALGLPEG